ncbi:FlgO family outer membrane protein [Aliiglaciecola sp. CAU 1673]|uniref:FlgO family outer membrane protein n=1 Tax=Aliiglaciecola sp. CAU 1673 TaxID=3032595 RepID=UPI0023DB55D0|nr:FlgO family outer membrane protein [Aliiglaciecola sp. CAU 1673]MDF2178045.1 FlgO family outer membrane protein [Aliiglaciecola sp. CAU 1673]
MKYLLSCVLCCFLLACASQPEEALIEAPLQQTGNAEFHTYELAQELFASLEGKYPQARQYRFAAATFVPITSLKYNQGRQHPLMLLGHQLAQGMITESSRRGYLVQDFLATNDIIMEEQAERVLSRQLSQLETNQNVDFYITGTITEQSNGAVVNAKVVHSRSKTVVAGATKFFPNELFWPSEHVTTRDGMIYRQGAPE